MAEIRAELSDDAPPFLAIETVTLELPPDILDYLQARGVVEARADYFYFQYRKDLKIPILPKE